MFGFAALVLLWIVGSTGELPLEYDVLGAMVAPGPDTSSGDVVDVGNRGLDGLLEVVGFLSSPGLDGL